VKEIQFPNWREILARQTDLGQRQKQSFEISIGWYLSFCRRARVSVTIQSARDFMDWAVAEKKPQPWQIEQWKEAIRWFFRAAQASPPAPEPENEQPVWMPEEKEQWPAWKVAFLTTLRRRHYSYRTEQSYLVWIERFARFFKRDDLENMGSEQIRSFLDALALDEQLSASSQRQALNALVFLFREVFEQELGDFSDYRRAKARTNLPVWLTREELGVFFEQLQDPWRLMAQVMYGGGLRLMDLLRLRVKDADLAQQVISVWQGKGDKNRFVPLAHVVVERLGEHLKGVKALYEGDRRANVEGVWLPEGLSRKYRNAGKEWPWFWLWPDASLSRDPRSGLIRRHHVSDRSLQFVIKDAGQKAGLNKRMTPHVLRHTFATHLVDANYDIRTVQELLGHKDVATTMIYAHVMKRPGLGVRSPLDL
jgi:integron integrase